jgi:preprotein translocase subunit SecA
VATTIFRVTVKREPATVPLPGPGQPGSLDDDGRDDRVAVGASVSSGSTSATGSGPIAGGPMEPGGAVLRSPGTRTGTATGYAGGSAAPIRGLPADPMRTARQAPGDAAVPGQTRPGLTPSGAKIGRNDPCWCGSGVKYKKCHGA